MKLVAIAFVVLVSGPAIAQVAESKKSCLPVPQAEHARCIATRDYVSKAKAVVDGHLDPIKLPSKPKGFSNKYVTPNEKTIIDDAVTKSVAAMAVKLWGR